MAQTGRNLDPALDQGRTSHWAFATRLLSELKSEAMLHHAEASFQLLNLGTFRFIAAHNFSRVLHYLSLFIIVFSGKNSQQVFTIPEHDHHWDFSLFLFFSFFSPPPQISHFFGWVNENVSKLWHFFLTLG
jgi:hypothetical protein